jgi:ABC-type transport system substrate-binding protein
MDQGPEKLRINPRKSSYYNLAGVSTNGDWEVTFHLKRPQPAFPMLLASGFSVIFPCHVPPREMRQHPIGTGPTRTQLSIYFTAAASLNWSGYCNPSVDELIERQSREADADRRKPLLWEIERKLATDDARPIIFYPKGVTCRQPYVKGLTVMVNSVFNGWRMEDVWLDK